MITTHVHIPAAYEVASASVEAEVPFLIIAMNDLAIKGELLLDPEDSMIRAIKTAVESWPEEHAAKGKAILKRLKKNNRLTALPLGAEPCAAVHACDLAQMLVDSGHPDTVVIPFRCKCDRVNSACLRPAATTARDYVLKPRLPQSLSFEEGCPRQDFEDAVWKPILRHAKTVTVIDRHAGKLDGGCANVVENYRIGLEWLAGCVSDYCEMPSFRGVRLVTEYSSRAKSSPTTQQWVRSAQSVMKRFGEDLSKISGHPFLIEPRSPGDHDRLPHDRFVATDQLVIQIGRGVDLFRRNGTLRDTTVSVLSGLPKSVSVLCASEGTR